MSAIEAAIAVLRDASEPLHYRELTQRMLAQGLWATSGKTPWNTVNALIAVDIKDRGADSRFVRFSPGYFTLNPNVASKKPLAESSPIHEQDKGGNAGEKLSFADAAERILSQSSNNGPLHYGEITERALKFGLISTEGKTPAATMYSSLWTEIRRRKDRGESPRFEQHSRGMFGLAAWLPQEVAGLIEEKNREVRQELLDRARAAHPNDFEKLVGELLAKMGFEEVGVTNISGDGGIDVRCTLVVGDAVRIRMAVQAKRWKNNVSAPVVRQVRGSLGAHERGLIITTSDFSKGAKDEAKRSDAAPVALMNGEQLAVLLATYEMGARVKSYELFVIDDLEAPEE